MQRKRRASRDYKPSDDDPPKRNPTRESIGIDIQRRARLGSRIRRLVLKRARSVTAHASRFRKRCAACRTPRRVGCVGAAAHRARARRRHGAHLTLALSAVYACLAHRPLLGEQGMEVCSRLSMCATFSSGVRVNKPPSPAHARYHLQRVQHQLGFGASQNLDYKLLVSRPYQISHSTCINMHSS
jgi:hypothetical protein